MVLYEASWFRVVSYLCVCVMRLIENRVRATVLVATSERMKEAFFPAVSYPEPELEAHLTSATTSFGSVRHREKHYGSPCTIGLAENVRVP